MASVKRRPDGQWRARYRDGAGKEHARHFSRRTDAQQWLDQEITKQQTGSWIAPRAAKITVEEWCTRWLDGYRTRKLSTVRMAEVHIAKIVAAFGPRRLDSLRPSDIKSWLVQLQTEHAPSYVYALHSRLAQVLADAVHDGVLARNPCSRRTAPRTGSQRPYLATTAQVWALHDAMEERYRAGLLLASFAGLRLAEVCGLRVADVDFMRGIVSPVQQYPAEELKTEMSRTPVPIPDSLALALSAHVARYSTTWIMCDEVGRQMGPWQLQREFRRARAKVNGLPDGFRFHDLRHYFASLLIASNLDVKTVQIRLRHASAKTTLDTYGHLWPDSDDSTRAAIDVVMTARAENLADFPRTRGGGEAHPS
jgi:integrase